MMALSEREDAGAQALRNVDASAATPEGLSQPSATAEIFRVAEHAEMRKFVETVFARCKLGKGWIAARAFEHANGGAAVLDTWLPFNRELVLAAVPEATTIASRTFERRAVFAPPVCVFGDLKNERGTRSSAEHNVALAPAIAVELDDRPSASLDALKRIIGEPTIIVASGGEWADPETGELEDKLHVYWRLDVPASDRDQLAKLKRARTAACRLVAADGTGVSVVHPMRWPGSWHTKADPRLCRIVGGEHKRDVKLDWAADVLEQAMINAGLDVGGAAAQARAERKGFKTKREWPLATLMDAANLIPNADVPWDLWNTIGMAFFDASHASADGLEAFHAWSMKDDRERYEPNTTGTRWSHWFSSPPSDLSAGKLLHLIREVLPDYRPAHDYIDMSAPPAAQDGAPAVTMPPFVVELNARHAFVMNRGAAVVINVDRPELSFSTRTSFTDRYANEPIKMGGRTQSKAEWWWSHPQRSQYLGGVDFDPDGVAPDVFNLWRGLPPLPGGEAGAAGCPRILQHISEVICAGDAEAERYLIGWLAHMIQCPGDKPGVAVALRGKKGTGKDTLGEFLERILGPYYMMVSAAEQVTGRFNAHMAGRILLHVEEAVWAGDKKGESVLKSLITAPSLTIEAKGVNAVMMKSRMRIFMTSNEDWVVPATADERRFFFLNVSDCRCGDREWFDALRRELNGAGPACLAMYLRNYDLRGFVVREVPATAALLEQKLRSMPPVELWLYECLQSGSIGYAGWPESIAVDELFRLFNDAQGKGRSLRPVGKSFFGKTVQTILRPGITKPRVPNTEERSRHYRLPKLAEARAAFAVHIGQVVSWVD